MISIAIALKTNSIPFFSVYWSLFSEPTRTMRSATDNQSFDFRPSLLPITTPATPLLNEIREKRKRVQKELLLLHPRSTLINRNLLSSNKPRIHQILDRTSATSFGLPAQVEGRSWTSFSSFSCAHSSPFSLPSLLSCAALIRPGATRLTRIPKLCKEMAVPCMSPSCPALLLAQPSWFGSDWCDWKKPMWMMQGPGLLARSSMAGGFEFGCSSASCKGHRSARR